MRIIAGLVHRNNPPLLQLFIHDAPHRRMHIAIIQKYRLALVEACSRAGIAVPITHPIDLSVVFINPATPDLGNAYLALEQALDHATLTKPGVIIDDSLIHKVTMLKMFPNPKK